VEAWHCTECGAWNTVDLDQCSLCSHPRPDDSGEQEGDGPPANGATREDTELERARRWLGGDEVRLGFAAKFALTVALSLILILVAATVPSPFAVENDTYRALGFCAFGIAVPVYVVLLREIWSSKRLR